MPALFGYLVALVLLLGGGYAGLQWLGSPDEAGTHQHIGEKPTARNVPKKSGKSEQSEKSEFDGGRATAVAGEADAGGKIGTTASATADMGAPHQSDHAANQTETPEGAHAGRKDDVAATRVASNLNSELERRPGKPAETSREGSQDAKHKDDTKHKDDAVQKDDAQVTAIAATPKPGEPRSEPAVKPARPDRRNVRSSRSRLVMMYLRTIEFPDGHREQQLLPIRRARRMAVEADDQW